MATPNSPPDLIIHVHHTFANERAGSEALELEDDAHDESNEEDDEGSSSGSNASTDLALIEDRSA